MLNIEIETIEIINKILIMNFFFLKIDDQVHKDNKNCSCKCIKESSPDKMPLNYLKRREILEL